MRPSDGTAIKVGTLCMVCGAAFAQGIAADASPSLPATPASAAMAARARVEVWVVLSEPALVTLPRTAVAERKILMRRIVAQQNAVMTSLAALGGSESARLQQLSNSIAVEIGTDAIKNVRRIKGVIAVRPVSHRNKIPD